MQKRKKVILFFTLLLSLLGLFMIYWEAGRTVLQCLPEGVLERVEIHGMFFEEYLVYTPEEDTVPRIKKALETETVSRGPEFLTLNGDAFLLWCYIEGVDGPITMTVREDGRLDISEMGSNHRYYEGATELFSKIQTITKNLPAENLRKE